VKTIQVWRWWITDELRGKRHATRHHMTEADALATDPKAERVEGSMRELRMPEGPHEHEHTQPGRRR
jgi:hypothetical protein